MENSHEARIEEILAIAETWTDKEKEEFINRMRAGFGLAPLPFDQLAAIGAFTPEEKDLILIGR
jgi:hypothetical protein